MALPTGLAGEDPRIGREIGNRIRIDERIAAGAVGTVYRATQIALGRAVAVKFVEAKYAERARREATLAARLSHPNIAHVVDAGSTPAGEVFVVLELVDGPTLREAAASALLSPLEWLDVLAQVGDALDHTKRSGLIHTDITPSNVLIERRRQGWRAKVVDFGLALESGQPAQEGVLGTPAYLAPEQARQQPLDAACDVYALSVIAFECIEGALPFASPTPLAALANKLTQPIPVIRAACFPPSAREHFASLVTRGLQQEPSERPSAADFASAMRLIAAAVEQEAPAPSPAKALPDENSRAAEAPDQSAAPPEAAGSESAASHAANATRPAPTGARRPLGRAQAVALGAAFMVASMCTAFVGVRLLDSPPPPPEPAPQAESPADETAAPAAHSASGAVALGAVSEARGVIGAHVDDAQGAAERAAQRARAEAAAAERIALALRGAQEESEAHTAALRDARARMARRAAEAAERERIAAGQRALSRAREAHSAGDLESALRLYEEFLETAPPGEERTRIQRMARRLRQ